MESNAEIPNEKRDTQTQQQCIVLYARLQQQKMSKTKTSAMICAPVHVDGVRAVSRDSGARHATFERSHGEGVSCSISVADTAREQCAHHDISGLPFQYVRHKHRMKRKLCFLY